MDIRKSVFAAIAAFFLIGQAGLIAQPSASVFTYQGSLASAGDQVTGTYDLRFRLYDSASGGAQVGAEVLASGTPVENGLFSVPLDFGPLIDGPGYWLEIEVRPAGSGDYTLLSPRQAVHAAPLATFALNAGKATTASVALAAAKADVATTASVAMNGVPSGSMILGNSSTPPPGYTWSGKMVAGNAEWVFRADAPGQALDFSGDMVDGKIYSMRDDVTMVYDPVANTWDDSLAVYPHARTLFYSATAIDGKIYVVGGASAPGWDNIDIYDPATDTWETAGTPGPGEPILASCAVNGKLYVFLGNDELRIYDPVEDAWTTGETSLYDYYYQVVDVGGKMYQIGSEKCYVYDPNLDDGPGGDSAWRELPAMPTERVLYGVVVLKGKIHVLGGMEHYGSPDTLATHEIYDPETGRWEQGMPMRVSRYYLLVAADDDYIYINGGVHADSTDHITLVSTERYEPPVDYYVHVKD